MPYISLHTNTKITKEKEIKIKERLGEAITIISKTEQWLMIEFKDECQLYFQGEDNKKIAYIEVKLYGMSTADAYNNLTKKITDLVSVELDISPTNIYVNYAEYDNWGWNGQNF